LCHRERTSYTPSAESPTPMLDGNRRVTPSAVAAGIVIRSNATAAAMAPATTKAAASPAVVPESSHTIAVSAMTSARRRVGEK
jgi:hypothetical protein